MVGKKAIAPCKVLDVIALSMKSILVICNTKDFAKFPIKQKCMMSFIPSTSSNPDSYKQYSIYRKYYQLLIRSSLLCIHRPRP